MGKRIQENFDLSEDEKDIITEAYVIYLGHHPEDEGRCKFMRKRVLKASRAIIRRG